MTTEFTRSEANIRRAVYRSSCLMFDNWGISASMSDMPSAGDKRAALRALYPRGRLGRFLLRIQPKKKLRLRAAYNFWDDQVYQERSNYYLDKAMELMKDAK